MKNSQNFTRQHDDLLIIVADISKYLNSHISVTENASEISNLMAKFSGKLKVHLAMEDQSLYPSMMSSDDKETSETSNRFSREMGDLSAIFQSYMMSYRTSKEIRNKPEVFLSDTKKLFKALGDRIDRENTILFPLFDKMH